MVPTPVIAQSLALFVFIATATEGKRIDTSNWVMYQSAATGLTFRYPPALRIRERDVQEFNFPDTELVVDLIGDTEMNPGSVVLRFIVKRGEATPQTVRARTKLLRQASGSTPISLDGRQAFITTFCVSAGCHWSVEVVEPRECSILSVLAGEDSKESAPPPHDGLFPLLSIIKTLHFEPIRKP